MRNLCKIFNVMLFSIGSTVDAYKIAIVGAHGGLGRELVKQSLDKKWKVCAMVRRNDPIFEPIRQGWLNEDQRILKPIRHKNLDITTNYKDCSFDSIVFSLSGKPFQKDESYKLVQNICQNLPPRCKQVCLVSAYGVGSSLKDANYGIKVMNSWYLKDVYESKYIQEQIVCNLSSKVDTFIIRPKVLSYDIIPLNPISTTRQDLARNILDEFGSKN